MEHVIAFFIVGFGLGCQHCVEVSGQLVGVGTLIPSCGSWRLNSGRAKYTHGTIMVASIYLFKECITACMKYHNETHYSVLLKKSKLDYVKFSLYPIINC